MLDLNYNFNKDLGFISRIAHPERLEVIVNELCAPNCPIRQQHYEYESRLQLDGKAAPLDGECKRPRGDFADLIGGPVVFSKEEIARLRADYGVRYFKIAGRSRKSERLLGVLLYYLVKPEYHEDVRRMICE